MIPIEFEFVFSFDFRNFLIVLFPH